jgi:hypothetical protein
MNDKLDKIDKLTTRAEMACQIYVKERLTQHESYKKAGYKESSGNNWNSQTFFKEPKIVKRVKEIRDELIQHIDKECILFELKKIIEDPQGKTRDKMQAITILNDMSGFKSPSVIKSDINSNINTTITFGSPEDKVD